MAYSDAQRRATAKYKATHGRVTVSFDLRPTDAQAWQAYAQQQGHDKLTTLVRECVARCMQADKWSMEDERQELDSSRHDVGTL